MFGRQIQAVRIVIICFFVFIFCVNDFFLYLSFVCSNSSPYLPSHYFCNWNGYIPFQSLLVSSLIGMFIIISDYFPSWITDSLICGKILFNAYQIYLTLQFPFLGFQTNALYLTVYATVILLDIYTLIVDYSGIVNRVIYFCIFFIFPLFSYSIIYFSLSHYYKSIKKNLSGTSLEEFDFDENKESSIPNNQKLLKDLEDITIFLN
jgi:hypothetical protein